MKNRLLITILLFICGNILYSQNTLSVKLIHCKNEKGDTFGFDEITLYKNDSVYKIDNSVSDTKYFDNLSGGRYKVKYKTFFGSEISNEIIIPNEKRSWPSFEVEVCIDKLSDSFMQNRDKLFLTRIKEGEEIQLKYSFAGCFNSGEDSISITKKKDHLYLNHKNKKRKLNEKEIAYLLNYEAEMRNILPVDIVSTGNALNSISYNGETFNLLEPSSFWGGYNYLKKKLKLK